MAGSVVKGRGTSLLLLLLLLLLHLLLQDTTRGEIWRNIKVTNTSTASAVMELTDLLSSSDLFLIYHLSNIEKPTRDRLYFTIHAHYLRSPCHHYNYANLSVNFLPNSSYANPDHLLVYPFMDGKDYAVFLKATRDEDDEDEEYLYNIIGVTRPIYRKYEEICKYYSECWEPNMTLNSSSMMYTEVKGQVTAYQVTPGAGVNITCTSDRIDSYFRFQGYNLTLTRREIKNSTNEEQEQSVTSQVALLVSDSWKATVTSQMYRCDVMWPGEPDKILASKNVTVRPVDTGKAPTLILTTTFPNHATCSSSSSSSSSSYVASFTFWAHPDSIFTWTHPAGAPENTTLYLKGTTQGYVLLNTTFTAFCSTWGNPPPSLALTTCTNVTCKEEKTETVLVTRSIAQVRKEWQVRVPSSALLMNLTCAASSDQGQQDTEALQVIISDAPSLEEHLAKVTWHSIERDNVTLPCHLSLAQVTGQSALTAPLLANLTWGAATQGNLTLSLSRSMSPYLQSVELSFSPVQVTEEGVYTCVAGEQVVTTVDLRVASMEEPRWVSANETRNRTFLLHKREILTFNCSATGVPTPNYRWTKDGEEKMEEEQEEELTEGGGRGRGGGGGGRGRDSLTILKGQPRDEGLYVCEVENRAGRLVAWYKVEFLHPETSVVHVRVALAVVGLLMVLMIGWCVRSQWRTYKYTLKAARAWKEGNVDVLNRSLSLRDQAHLLPVKPKFEISRHQVTFDKLLGCGAFGRVYRATVTDLNPDDPNMTVAVKMIRARSDKNQLLALQSELKILMHIGKHVNIVNLVATCTKNLHKKDLMLVVEYCRFGNLLDYMRRHRTTFINQLAENGEEFLSTTRPISSCSGVDGEEGSGNKVYISADRVMFHAGAAHTTTTTTIIDSRQALLPDPGLGQVTHLSSANTHLGSDMTCLTLITDTHNLEGPSLPCDPEHLSRPLCSRDLLCWGFQVARGMDFLAYRKVLHGDLAARNVLLTDGNLVKISDFGLAKDIYKYNNYRKDKNSPLPVKWMSVEALREGIFSTQSDVWAYGVVLWEIFSLGQCPFPGVSVDEGFIKALESGYRMERPKYSTRALYQVMLDCWATVPEMRPSFSTLEGRLSKMLYAGDSKYYEDLQKAVEAKEAMEGEEQDPTYLNMVCSLDYANLVQTNGTENLEEPPVEGDAADDYVPINSCASSPVEASEVPVQAVVNKGYVSLSSVEGLMVGSGRGRGSVPGLGATAEETGKEEQPLLCQ